MTQNIWQQWTGLLHQAYDNPDVDYLLYQTAAILAAQPLLLRKLVNIIHANGMNEVGNELRRQAQNTMDVAGNILAYETKTYSPPRAPWNPAYAPPRHNHMVLVRWGMSPRRTNEGECENYARYNNTADRWEWLDEPHPTTPTYKPIDTTSEFIYEWSEQ